MNSIYLYVLCGQKLGDQKNEERGSLYSIGDEGREKKRKKVDEREGAVRKTLAIKSHGR